MSALQPLLTTEEICKSFRIKDRTLYNWRKREVNPFPEPCVKGFPNKWKLNVVEDFLEPTSADAA